MNLEELAKQHRGFLGSMNTSPGQMKDSAAIVSLIGMLQEKDAEIARLRGIVGQVVFLGTKGTATLWPARALMECVRRCQEALKGGEGT